MTNKTTSPYFLPPVKNKSELIPNPISEWGDQPEFCCMDLELSANNEEKAWLWIYKDGNWADEAVQFVESAGSNNIFNMYTSTPISYSYHYCFQHQGGGGVVRYESGILETGEKITVDNYDDFRAELKQQYDLRNDSICIMSLTDVS
jgi:hypothetical protein